MRAPRRSGGGRGLRRLPAGALGVRAGGAFEDGFVYAAGCLVRGGDGGPGCDPPGIGFPFAGNGADGGPGIEVLPGSARVELLDSLVQGGLGGPSNFCTPGATGPDTVDPGGLLGTLRGRSYPLEADSPLRVGETGTLHFEGDPGELLFLGFSPDPFTFFYAPFKGVSLLGLPASSLLRFHLQSVAVTLQAEIVLGGGSALELLSISVP